MKWLQALKRFDFVCVSACFWLIWVWIIYGGSIPYLDGAIDFVQSYQLFSGGFINLFSHWGSLHPPLKPLMVSALFSLFGVTERSYTLLGVGVGVVGVISAYLLGLRIGGKTVGRLLCIFVATSPLFVSVGLFSLTDFLVCVFGLMSFVAFFSKRYLLWGISLMLAVLSKETALLLPFVFVVVLSMYSVYGIVTKKYRPEWRYLYVILSFAAFLGWLLFAKSFGKGMWNDWIFITGERFGAIGAIWHNVTTGALFNDYLRENLLHLFVLNFQWVMTIAAGFGCYFAYRKFIREKHTIDIQTRIGILCMVLYVISYCFFVLSFQTYPIPRYTLPVEPYVLLAASCCLALLFRKKILRIVCICVVAGLSIARFSYSLDPVSYVLWGSISIDEQKFYGVNEHLSGNDGITYNGQFLTVVRTRTQELRLASENDSPVISFNCRWTFADVRNDDIVLPALSYTGIPNTEKCIDGNSVGE